MILSYLVAIFLAFSGLQPIFADDPAYLFPNCKDHFSGDCNETYNQRYWYDNTYYNNQTNSPIYFQLGGEANAQYSIYGGSWVLYAANQGALLVVLEHRFYGESYPSAGPSDRSPETMKLLTSQQALADAAKFITWFKSSMNMEDSKVVVFGGSYPGALTAWFRQYHPDLANIAVASSAPLDYNYLFPDYYGTAASVIKQVDPMCYTRIEKAFACMDNLVHHNKTCGMDSKITNMDQLPAAVHQCGGKLSRQTPDDQEIFFYNQAAQWGNNYPGDTAKKLCPILDKENSSDVISMYGQFTVDAGLVPACARGIETRRRLNKRAHNVGFSNTADADEHSWIWQTCNEFANFEVENDQYHLWGKKTWGDAITLSFCTDYYPTANFTAKKVQDNVKATNDYYGGTKGFKGTCTIFVNGLWDPWHWLSIYKQKDTTSKNKVIVIPHGQHCDDGAYPPKNPELAAAQTQIMAQIAKYLKMDDC